MNRILPIIVLLTILFFSPQKVNAQTDSECFRVYQKEEYKCLQTRTKCTQSCSGINNLKACSDSCSAQDKTCSEQASADLTACKAAIPKDKKDVPSKAESGQDCRKIFDRETYKCLGVSGDCQRECSEETKRPDGGTYFNSGEIYSKCTKASDCDGKGRACNEQALVNFRACGKSDKESAEAKKEAPVQDKKGVNIFKIFELFSKAVTNLATNKEKSDPSQKETQSTVERLFANTKFGAQQIAQVNDWIMENDLTSDPKLIEQMEREKLDLELYGRTPQMTDEIVKKAQSEWEAMFTKTNEESIAVVNGRGQFTTPEGFIVLGPQDKPLKVTFIDDTFVNPNSETTQLNYTWDKSSGAVVSIPSQSEVKFLKPVQDEKTQQLKRMLKLNKGEVEIKVKNNNLSENQFGVDAGWLGVTVSRTHFWVSQSQDKNLVVIGVYEGEVEVKSKDGKVVKVKPDGDPSAGSTGSPQAGSGQSKPGVVVVSRKLSTIRLTIAGVILAAILSGIAFLLKKRGIKVLSPKKKTSR